MVLVKQWLGFSQTTQSATTDNFGFGGFNAIVPAGATLLRTIGQVEFKETANFPHFPPEPAAGIAFGFFQGVNTDDPSALPFVDNSAADFVWWQMVGFNADFGAVSAVQSDLTWNSYTYFDSQARRQALVDNPAVLWSFGPVQVNPPDTPRLRSVTWSIAFRQLWQHEI